MLRKLYKRFLAFYRVDLNAVCEMSTKERDYHDYPDDEMGKPWHFVELKCKRCGKGFYI